ncbi:recombinase family protein [Myxococcota bacterium]
MRKTASNSPIAKAAIYSRMSTVMQATDSCDTQIARARRAVGEGSVQSRLFPDHGLAVAEQFVIKDEATSGTTSVSRVGYQVILDGIVSKAFDVLLVDDLSRLTRELGEHSRLWNISQKHNVEIIGVSDGFSTADADGRTAYLVKGLINDLANTAHANRTISRMREHFQNGFSMGSLPYGYTSVATDEQMRGSGQTGNSATAGGAMRWRPVWPDLTRVAA